MKITFEFESEDVLLTRQQLATRLQMSDKTIEGLEKGGLLPVIRIGARIVRYHWPAVCAALQINGRADGGISNAVQVA